MSPKISIVIPVYNTQKYLDQCLGSILLQTYRDFEVICVNDGSTDDSLKILQKYAQLDNRVKVINQKNMGISPARNEGMKIATGEYIIFLDSDDFFDSAMMEEMVKRADATGADITICSYSIFDDKLQKDVREICLPLVNAEVAPPERWGRDLFNLSGATWNKLIRFSLIKEHNLIFDDLPACQDISVTCLLLTLAKKVAIIPKCFVHYRRNIATQHSVRYREKHPETTLQCMEVLWNNMKAHGTNEKFSEAFFERLRIQFMYHMFNCNPQEKKEFLLMGKTCLSPEIYERFLGTSPVKVSIIVPVYNQAEFLPICLDSLINQTLKDIEIICVDDGSTDNSLKILQEYAKKDKRIKVLTQTHQKQYVARQKGMDAAVGDYIQFVDADDWVTEDCCEALWTYAQIKYSDIILFSANCYDERTKQIINNPYYNFEYLPEIAEEAIVPRSNPQQIPAMCPAIPLAFFKRSFLLSNKLEWSKDGIYYEDIPFFTKCVFKSNCLAFFREKFYFHRLHPMGLQERIGDNFSDFCKSVCSTLKYVHDFEHKEVFIIFLNYYATRIFNIFKGLSKNAKDMYIKDMYDFAGFVYATAHVRLFTQFEKLIEKYEKNIPLKRRISFEAEKALAKYNKPHLMFPLFELRRGADFSFKILNIPIFARQKRQGEAKIKLFGIPCLKKRSLFPKSTYGTFPERKILNVKKRSNEKIIVSLASYSARIKTVHETIKTLLNQTIKPDKIILWLGKDNCSEKMLPSELKSLVDDTFEIRWIKKDIGPFKKLIPALKAFPKSIIVTADDDILYQDNWLEELLFEHKKHSKDIICHCAHRIVFKRGFLQSYNAWSHLIGQSEASFSNFFTTGGGVLFPPNTFHKDVFKEDLFLKLCPCADDIWFWSMAVKNNKKARTVARPQNTLSYVPTSQQVSLLKTNVWNGQNNLWIDAVLKQYPEVLRKVKNERIISDQIYLFGLPVMKSRKKAKNIDVLF